jgi:plasmid stabilization system protein ParE
VAADLHREALAELRRAAIWYDEQRPGLGDEFVDEIGATIERLSDHPGEYSVWPGTKGSPVPIRRALVKRFPYAIAFESQADVTFILAVAHAKRRPLYWLHRIGTRAG